MPTISEVQVKYANKVSPLCRIANIFLFLDTSISPTQVSHINSSIDEV